MNITAPQASRRVATVASLVAEGVLEIGDGYRATNAELGGDGPRFLRAADIGSTVRPSGDRIRGERLHLVGAKRACAGDVVLTTKGTVGRVALIPPNTEPVVYSPQLSYWRVRDRDRLNPSFLFAWLRGPQARRQLDALKNQTDMAPYVSLRDQLTLRVELPAIDQQRAIAEVLGALDDKIGLNRRVNASANCLLRGLFSALAPLQSAPRTIDSLARVVGGSTPSTTVPDYWEGGLRAWATPKDMSQIEVPILDRTERTLTDAGLRCVGSGLLPVGTVLLSSRAPIGYLAISAAPLAINQGIIGMIPGPEVSPHFLLRWAEASMDEIKSRANGTTFQEISKRNFRPMLVHLPSPDARREFDRVAAPLHDLLLANVRQNRTLAELRDLLLPKLISGEMRVREAEEAVDSAR